MEARVTDHLWTIEKMLDKVLIWTDLIARNTTMWKFRRSDLLILIAVIGGSGVGYLLAGVAGMCYGLIFGATVNAGYLLLRLVIVPLAIRFVKYKNRFPSN